MWQRASLAIVTVAMLLVMPGLSLSGAGAAEPTILARDKIWVRSDYNFQEAFVPIRYADYGRIKRWEVKIPNGGWQSCKGDCADYYRCEVFDYWECRSETGNGHELD